MTLSVYNPVTASMRVTGGRVSATTTEDIAPVPGETPLATVEAGAQMGCALAQPVMVNAYSWTSIDVVCEARLGNTTGQTLSNLLLHAERAVSVYTGYAVDAELYGYAVNASGNFTRNFSLGTLTALRDYADGAAQQDYLAVASQCSEPFREIDELLRLSNGTMTKCPTATDSLLEVMQNELNIPLSGYQCQTAPAAIREMCASLQTAGQINKADRRDKVNF